MINLLDREVIGQGIHSSGWPWCVNALSQIASGGILFDDFVERNFIYEPIRKPYTEPWIGVFHHPPFIPNEIHQIDKYSLCNLTALNYCKSWKDSKKHLIKAITFTTESAVFIERWLGVPSFVVTHPTKESKSQFTNFDYESNQNKKVIQIGMQLRNLRGIYQLPHVVGISRARSKPHGHHIDRDLSLIEYWKDKRIDFGGVEELNRLQNNEYDQLLSANVVFLELFGAVANNVVVECMIRNTPILINRLNATIEYLGADYPLFYNNLHTAADLLNSSAVKEAHHYLIEMNKSQLSINNFTQRIKEIIES